MLGITNQRQEQSLGWQAVAAEGTRGYEGR